MSVGGPGWAFVGDVDEPAPGGGGGGGGGGGTGSGGGPGGPSSWRFEVQWDGINWIDESAWVKAGDGFGVTITQGRGSDADAGQPGVMTLTLDNVTGRFSPDSPLSPLWPLVRDGVRCRLSVTRGDVTSTRFQGRISVGAPDMPGGIPAAATVEITATDVLGQLAKRKLRCDYVERWMATGSPSAVVDLWPFESVTSVSTANLGSGVGTGRLVGAFDQTGSAKVVIPDSMVLLDAAVELTPTGTIGPVVVLHGTRGTPWLDICLTCSSTARAPGGGSLVLAFAEDATGAPLWSVRLVDVSGRTDMQLWGPSSALATIVTGFAAASGGDGDGLWRHIRVVWDGDSWSCWMTRIDDGVMSYVDVGTSVNFATTSTVVLGGLMTRRAPGRQSMCTAAQFGAFVLSAPIAGHWAFLVPTFTQPSQTRVQDIASYVDVAYRCIGARSRTIMGKSISGRTAFDVLSEVARTVGAIMCGDTAQPDAILWWDSDVLRIADPPLEFSAELHLDGTPGLPRRIGGVPSSVTASWPGGSIVWTDPTQPVQSDGSVDTCASDDDSAMDVAAMVVTASRKARITQLTVDVAGATDDIWAPVLSLHLGSRIRLNLGTSDSVLCQQWGVVYLDVYIVGWTERYAEGIAAWTLDTVPADDPVEGMIDDSFRGRISADGSLTVTGGTAVGTTSTGTIVVTTNSGTPFSAASGDYPVILDWNGENILVWTAPGSATSPQTLTITTRGVGYTIARAHAAGEPIDVCLPMTFTI